MADDEQLATTHPAVVDDGAGRRHRPRWLVPVAVLVVLGLVVAAGVVVADRDGDGPRDPEEALASAQAFLDDAESFAFEMAQTTVIADGDPDARSGSEMRDRVGGSGAWSAERWQLTAEGSGGTAEVVHADGETYTRFSTGDEDVPAQWSAVPEEPQTEAEVKDAIRDLAAEIDDLAENDTDAAANERDALAVTLAAELYLNGAGDRDVTTDDPRTFLRLIESLDEPATVEESADGVLTLEGTLEPDPEFEEAFGSGLPLGTVQVDLDADDVPIAVRLTVAEGGTSLDLEVTFTDWDEPVTVEAPPEDEIDPTPWVDESQITDSGIPLYGPTALPEGWMLWSAYLIPAEEALEECDQLNLSWSSEDDEEGYLELYVLPVACALDADDTPFEVGAHAPLATRGVGFLEVLIGDVVLQVDTDLTGSELGALVASLAPLDADTVFAQLAAANAEAA